MCIRDRGYTAGSRVPLLLRIHGGPNSQDAHSFSTEKQIFAANGYAVLAVNYRGSSGRGQKFSRAIAADWGHYEVEDLEAGVDYAIRSGVADPARLGVGGWSYGAILTDYMIATDTRFKAATSGAGTAFTVAFYGTDQYITPVSYTHLQLVEFHDVGGNLHGDVHARRIRAGEEIRQRQGRFEGAGPVRFG